MKRSEDQADDEDCGEANRKHIIKRDGFKDDSEDSTDEEAMKQDDAPKTQEVIKKELATTADITSATAMETEIQEGAREDTAEMNEDKTDEEDVVNAGLVNISAPVAPCKSLFDGEKVAKVRKKSQKTPNSQLLKNWRLKGLMLTNHKDRTDGNRSMNNAMNNADAPIEDLR